MPRDLRTSLKIILVVGSLEIGGTERQVVRLACELRDRGHEVTVLVLLAGGPLEGELRSHGVEVWFLGFEGLIARNVKGRLRAARSLRLLARWFRLSLDLRRRRPDVVHAFLFWSYVLVLPAAWLARVKLRVSGRRNLGTEKLARSWYPKAESLADSCAHLAVANSRAVAETVISGGFPRERVRIIRNGIDLLAPATSVAKQPARGVVIANLIAYKGHMDLVEALDLLENPPVIDCYGEGPERERIERAAAQGRVEGRVRLHGRVDNAAEKYREAQFAVLASHEEGLPNAVLEAMASGLPVIATSVGGTPELIAHGETGLLVPPRAPLELARAIETIINDPSLRVELGRRARRRIEERFSWDKCVREHEDLYRGL